MKHIKLYFCICSLLLITACKQNTEKADAYGNFEAVEIVVSAETAGKIQLLDVAEGQTIERGKLVGLIDTTSIWLQKQQLKQQQQAIKSKKTVLEAQLKVQDQQLENSLRDQQRIHQLFDKNAATAKQKDDIDGAVALIKAQRQAVKAQFDGIKEELQVVQIQIEQLNENIRKSEIRQVVDGTILAKYAEAGELASPGKALFKTAHLETLDLKAYITGKQLTDYVLDKEVEVLIDGPNEMIAFPGKISWIASSAEFTPKTIQTKEERTDLVYAIKVRVGNDGRLKIGMPGEVHLINH